MAFPLVAIADSKMGDDTMGRHLEMLQRDPDNKELIKLVGFGYLNIGNYVEARKYGERLMELAERNDDRNYCELYGHIIIGSASEDNLTEMWSRYQKALAIAEPADNHDAMLSIYNGLGIYYLFYDENTYTSISYYHKALDEARILGDSRRYAIVTSNLAGAYLARNDMAGMSIAEEAHEMAREQDDVVSLYYAKSTLLHFYLLADSLDRARRLIGEVENLHRSGGFQGQPNLYLEKAMLNERLGNIDDAYRMYNQAMNSNYGGDVSVITATDLSYARLLRKEKQYQKAIQILTHGLEIAKEARTPIHTTDMLRELALCNRDAGNYEQALDYSILYQTAQDSLIQMSREGALQEARIRNDVYRHEMKISDQKMELMRSRSRLVVTVCVLVVVLLLLGLLTYIHRKQTRLYRTIVGQMNEHIERENMLMAQIEMQRDAAGPSTAGDAPEVEHRQVAPQSLTADKQREIVGRFNVVMAERKLFTDPMLTVANVADQLGTNRTYLSKALNEVTGKTFTQLVNGYRIRMAIMMVSDPACEMPLKQLAAEVGFNSLSTFYTTFQAYTGMTPAVYRGKAKDL